LGCLVLHARAIGPAVANLSAFGGRLSRKCSIQFGNSAQRIAL
jgi:hypothetical protein